MSSTYSPILRTELIGAGDQAGTWGSTTNSNFQYIFEAAIAGYVAVTVSPTSNNQVLTYVNGPSASAALDQSVYGILKLNPGSLGANFNIFAPPVSKTYVVWNNTAYAATFYNSTVIGNTTAAGSGAVIPAGAKVMIWSDGTSFYGNDTVIGNFNVAGNLAVTGNATVTGNLNVTGSNNIIPAGTRMLFAQATAPVGFTQDVSDTANNRMLRVVASAGGGVGGSSDPILNNVVPYHTHGFTSGGQSVDHYHYTGGQTGGQSANHYHNVAGGTGYMDQSNPHAHSVYDPGHAHSIPDGFITKYGYGGSFGVRADYPVPSCTLGYGTAGAATGIGIYATDINHTHQFNVNSGFVSSDHSHAWGANSGGVSANHTHSGSTDGGSSQTNWTPRYVNIIICQKN
jgi:hypothetical protein